MAWGRQLVGKQESAVIASLAFYFSMREVFRGEFLSKRYNLHPFLLYSSFVVTAKFSLTKENLVSFVVGTKLRDRFICTLNCKFSDSQHSLF